MTRDEIYNEVIQDYSHLQYELEGDELQDKINEIIEDILHEKARELMEKLIEKYNHEKYFDWRKKHLKHLNKNRQMLEQMSLDEFLYEYCYILSEDEIDEITNLIDEFE